METCSSLAIARFNKSRSLGLAKISRLRLVLQAFKLICQESILRSDNPGATSKAIVDYSEEKREWKVFWVSNLL
jgi:hypothetical protein